MGYPTNIEWTDATWNPVGGCDIHSPGCANCYAQRLAGGPRLRNHPLYSGVTKVVKGKSVFNGMLTALPNGHKSWEWPYRWRGALNPRLGPGKPSLIFVGDMADLFHKDRDWHDIDSTLAPVVYSPHIGQVLTKRADVMADYLLNFKAGPHWLERHHPRFGKPSFDPAVTTPSQAIKMKIWPGFSAERQPEFDARWRQIEPLARAGWQIFVSCEPLLGRIVLPGNLGRLPRKPWIIAGGESGPDSRPAHPDWIRLLRDQCEEQGLPFFFKQWGEWAPGEVCPDLRARDCATLSDDRADDWFYDRVPAGPSEAHVDDEPTVYRIGKRASGHLLDGVEHRAFPVAA